MIYPCHALRLRDFQPLHLRERCAVASHSYELMVTLLVKMASNVSSLPSPNLYPPSDSIHLRTHSYRIESVDRTAAILPLHLRPQDDLVSLTDFRIESIPRSLNKYDEGEGREVIDKTWKFNRFHKICPDVPVFAGLYRLTRLAYLIFSAALNLITNAAWASINRGSGGRMSVCTRRIYPVRLLPTAVVSCTDTVKIV